MPAEQATYATTFTAKEDDWWTPQDLIGACRKVLGGYIDLDPASSPEANRRVRAERIYTKADNGLAQKWEARTVFLNPPSKRRDPLAKPALWAQKLDLHYTAGHVKEAVLIVKTNMGYNWYEDLYQRYWVCHLRERPHFLLGGIDKGQAKKGVSVFYMGREYGTFYKIFGEYGRVIPPAEWIEQDVGPRSRL